jgi:Domain of unknown function (DUF4936)
MEHWYVYYKVPARDTTAVAKRVRAMFNALDGSGARACLMQRAEESGDEVTLMEVYEPVLDAAAFGQLLDAAVHASGLAPAMVAARRIERFKEL